MPDPNRDTQTMADGLPNYGNNPKILFSLCVISDNAMIFTNLNYNSYIKIDNTNTWGI